MVAKLFLVCMQTIATVVVAQTPAGFNPSIMQSLQVAYGANDISPAGEMVARPGTEYFCSEQTI
jgi:hypothetical protein